MSAQPDMGLVPLPPGRDPVTLVFCEPLTVSRCGTYRTEDGDPFGVLTGAYCPERRHLAGMVEIVDRRFLPHHSPLATGCPFIGIEFVDDRHELASRGYQYRACPGGVIILLPPGAATRGEPFPGLPDWRRPGPTAERNGRALFHRGVE